MKKFIRFGFLALVVGMFLCQSCSDESEPAFPLSALIFHSVSDKQVAFTALTHSAVSWSWNFGDGQTSTGKDPVHVYDEGGYYLVTLTAMDKEGNTVTADVNLAIALTPYALLTGDHTQPGYDGKTWKLSQAHSVNDKVVNSDLELTLFDEDIEYLPAGAFDLYLGLKEAYNDQFTFYNDGTFKHNTTDGSSFAGIAYASVMQQYGQTTITKTGGKDVFGIDAFALATYTPAGNATFELVEEEDFSVPTIPDFATGVNSLNVPVVTYPGVTTIDFPNSTEFIGVMDFQRKVIVEEITDHSMRLVMFLCLSSEAIVSSDPLIALNTNALILTFEVID